MLGADFERAGDFFARFVAALLVVVLPRFLAAAFVRFAAVPLRFDTVVLRFEAVCLRFAGDFFRFDAPFPRFAAAAARFRFGGARMVPRQSGEPQRQG